MSSLQGDAVDASVEVSTAAKITPSAESNVTSGWSSAAPHTEAIATNRGKTLPPTSQQGARSASCLRGDLSTTAAARCFVRRPVLAGPWRPPRAARPSPRSPARRPMKRVGSMRPPRRRTSSVRATVGSHAPGFLSVDEIMIRLPPPLRAASPHTPRVGARWRRAVHTHAGPRVPIMPEHSGRAADHA